MKNKTKNTYKINSLELTRNENFINGQLDIMDIIALKNEDLSRKIYKNTKLDNATA